MLQFPYEIVNIIYDFDGRYKEYKNNVINELNNKINYNNKLNDTILDLFLYIPKDLYPDIYDKRSFYKFYFQYYSKS